MPRLPFLPKNEKFYDLLHQSAQNLVSAGEALSDLMHQYADVEAKTARLTDLEHIGDGTIHEIMALLHGTFITPLERDAIAQLAERMDDVLDYMEGATTAMRIYRVQTPRPRARELADVIRLMTVEIERAVALLRYPSKLKDILPISVELNRLENVADEIFRNALAELFEEESDAATIIKWRDIYDQLEAATDQAEDVANVLEGIVLEHA